MQSISQSADAITKQINPIVALLYQHRQLIAADIDFFIFPYAGILALAPHPEDFLTEAECQRAEQYHQSSDAERFSCARIALRCLLSHCAQKKMGLRHPKEWPLNSTVHGKPQLAPQTQPYYYFNWAHSGDYVALALSAKSQVGVDIEAERPLKDLLGIARMLYNKQEQQGLQELLQESKTKAQREFFRLWTCYEALSKLEGTGLLGLSQSSASTLKWQGQFKREEQTYYWAIALYNKSIIKV